MQRVIIAIVLSLIGANGTATTRSPLDPQIVTIGATSAQQERLDLAVARFAAAGLQLPDLTVEFHDDLPACRGHHGLFRASTEPWTVLICSDGDWVYEHELAHAWAALHLTDGEREEFVDIFDYESWNDADTAWRDRGTENAAVAIQQGLSGLPFPARLSSAHLEREAAFESLTGIRSPRMADWHALHGEPAAHEQPAVEGR